MVYLPQDIFKRILSFKDPRYERVMNGDPYMATPTRVFYTRDEFRINHNTPAICRHADENDFSRYIDVHFYIHVINEAGLFLSPMQHIRHLESSMDPIDSDDASDDVIRCSLKVAKMSLQCEACGPDLELYQCQR